MRKRRKFYLLLLTFAFLCGCLSRKHTLPVCPPSVPETRRLDVPPLFQTAFGCGPAALTMVLKYRGIDVSLEKVTAEVFSPSLEGTLITDMRDFARRYFPASRIEKASLCDVFSRVAEGTPVILFVDLGGDLFKRPHYLVVTGYDIPKGIVYVHNGYEVNSPVRMDALDEAWEKTGRLALIVTGDIR
ncbi:MAG: peptidase C39 [Deltaproteobacteria bacterium]|nr:MAG: peptidase C39 [Deltaproteobacteria bacterium]